MRIFVEIPQMMMSVDEHTVRRPVGRCVDLDRSRAVGQRSVPVAPENSLRYAWYLKLKLGRAHEFKQRHDEIWREMRALLSEAGYRGYAIFQHEDTIIDTFATNDLDRLLSVIGFSPVFARWRVNVGVGG